MPPRQVGGFSFAAGPAVRKQDSRATEAPQAAAADSSAPAASADAPLAGGKRPRIEENFSPSTDLQACWPMVGESELGRLSKFLEASGKQHVEFVRDSYGASYPYLEKTVQQVYETFAASCKNIIAEQSQADDERVPNPRNAENETREKTAMQQIEKYKEEMKQWERLEKMYPSKSVASRIEAAASSGDADGEAAAENAREGAEDEEDDGELDVALLARYPLAKSLDEEIDGGVSSAAMRIDHVTEALNAAKKQLQVAQAGTRAASAAVRRTAFADLPSSKSVLKALTSSATGIGGTSGS